MRINKTKCNLLGIGGWSFELQNERRDANLASGVFGNKVPVKIWPADWLKPVKSMLWCPYRAEIASWLQRMFLELGCHSPLQDSIHGHIGDCPNPRTVYALLQAYIIAVWKKRKYLLVPPVSKLEGLWAYLLRP